MWVNVELFDYVSLTSLILARPYQCRSWKRLQWFRLAKPRLSSWINLLLSSEGARTGRYQKRPISLRHLLLP